MSGEVAKEHVTAVPSKSEVPTYFRFSVASAYVLIAVCHQKMAEAPLSDSTDFQAEIGYM